MADLRKNWRMSENIVDIAGSPSGPAKQLSQRRGDSPVWIRAPKRGPEYYTGLTRPKLYELAAKGRIRSVSIREPGKLRGTRLFQLQSILAFIESHCEPTNEPTVTKGATKQPPLRRRPVPRRGSTQMGDPKTL